MKQKMLIFILLNLVLFGCSSQNPQTKTDQINAIVSILPQKAFVKAVGGDLVSVHELIPPGGSPATYEPKPGDLVKVEQADIYFRIGHIAFERSHAKKFESLNAAMNIVDTSRQLPLRYFSTEEEHSHNDAAVVDHHEAEIDPHIWLAPNLVKDQINIITAALVELKPDDRDVFEKNALAFKAKLDDLDAEISAVFKDLATDKLLVYHPAWGYFADRYGLQQIAIEQDGKEPTAKNLIQFLQTARLEDVKVIFVQAQFNEVIARSLADDLGAAVVSIDPLAEDYLTNMKNVSITIWQHLNR